MFSLAPFWIKVSKSVFFSTELLSSLLVSLCFDNRNVIKKNKQTKKKPISLKKQLLAAEMVGGGVGSGCLKKSP